MDNFIQNVIFSSTLSAFILQESQCLLKLCTRIFELSANDNQLHVFWYWYPCRSDDHEIHVVFNTQIQDFQKSNQTIYLSSVYYVVDSDEQAETAAFSYGYGATLPASSQRRMKQSVHLARRCLQLERQMVGDKRKMCELESTIENLRQEVK